MESPDIVKMRKSNTDSSNKQPDTEKTKEVAFNLINEILGFSQKFKITIEKSEKYSLKLWALNSPTDIISLIKSFVEEFTNTIDRFISSVLKREKSLEEAALGGKNPMAESDVINDEDYFKLEKELQKYEQKIRDQIRTEQQLKLHAESLQMKLDDNSKLNEEVQDNLEKKIESLQVDLKKQQD